MDKLHLIHIFSAVVKTGSFANAANHLSMSPSSISKAINRLETDLQCQLFHRSTRKLSLSAEGNAYFSTTTKIIEELHSCEETLKNQTQKPCGQLKLNLPVSYGRIYILPLISKFQTMYPEIDIHLSFDDSYVDLINGGYDLSIRTGTLEDKNHFTRKLSPMDFLICASPHYIKTLQETSDTDKVSIEHLEQQPWIQFRFKQTGRVMPISIPYKGGVHRFVPNKGIVLDDGEALAHLCSDHLGLTQIPHFIAKPWINRGDLMSLLPIYQPEGAGVFITYSEKNLLPTKRRVFIDFISQEMEAMGEAANRTWAEDLPLVISF